MKYSGSLANKEREAIFRGFLEKEKLRFRELETILNIRSNKVSYHLERMQKDGILEKKGNRYCLTKDAEKYIPLLSILLGEEIGPLPIVLVAVRNKSRILLLKRNKRPYKGYWGLVGGKMFLEESFKETSLRLVKEKTSLESIFSSIHSVLHERVSEQKEVKFGFIHFFTEVKTLQTLFKETSHGELKWVDLKSLEKEKIIPSDLWLLRHTLRKKVCVTEVHMREREEKLDSFTLCYFILRILERIFIKDMYFLTKNRILIHSKTESCFYIFSL